MSTITLRELRQLEGESPLSFEVELSFDGGGRYVVTVTNPFEDKEEQALEWYFERWLRRPFLDTVKAKRTQESIRHYGERLFEQIFSDYKARSAYEQLRGQLSQVRIEIEGTSPAFQALHWEALCDPDPDTRPLAVDCVMVRKMRQVAIAPVNPSPVVNLLVVIARPDEESDVGYRTISRPLVEAIAQSQLRVSVDIVRPGTYEAFVKQLNAKGEGYYHIVHFDMHGTLATYGQLQHINQVPDGADASDSTATERTRLYRSRLIEKGRYGRPDLAAFEGVQAFVSFEGAQKGEMDLVSAAELAQQLKDKRIPVCLLNACQSAKQLGAAAGEVSVAETSLGSRLMAAGMQMVVAMGYSVTVSAAKILMETLYGELFASSDVVGAIRQGRYELYMRKMRQAYFNQQINLEDWLLPVVYANGAVDLGLRGFTPEEEEAYYEALDRQYRFAEPTFGFVGRDLEILKIEKALLQHNALLLRGMGGTGKTTLLNYLRGWWLDTHYVEDVFYFGYDEKAYTLQQILHEMGKRVYKRFEFAKFQAMGMGAQRRKLADVLKAKPYALMLDNLESVTGQALAIQNTLPAEERAAIRDFLLLLVGGHTKVVLGSRGGEDWLEPVFKTNRYQLRGLDSEARTVLAEKILERAVKDREKIAALRQDREFERLMGLLAGYPLAMEVVLANLGRQSPGEILVRLDAADVALDSGAEDKTKSILKCVEYSHSNLSVGAQQLLLCLAPFKGFIDRADLSNYAKQLQALEPFQNWDFERFEDAVDEALLWGLLSPYFDNGDGRLLRIQPVFPYFLQAKLAEVDEALREGLATGFKEHYQGLARQYQKMMQSKEPEQRKLGLFFCELEYENLFSALQTCLEKQENVEIFFCLGEYLKQNQNFIERLHLSELVCEAHQKYRTEIRQGEIGFEIIMSLDRLASCYLETKNYSAAQQAYKVIVKQLHDLSGISDEHRQSSLASTYHQLGIVAQALREYEQARSLYQQALDIDIEFNDRYSQARTYHQLGNVAEKLREYEQARSLYQQALDIFIEYNDRYSQASTYHQLGRVAQALREYEQARSLYQQALDIKIEFNDRYEQASTYHQLGRVAQALREYEQARSLYQQALDIYIEFNDRYEQADTYHQLGIVAEELREYEQARSLYQQALDICIEFNDRYSQASTYHQLGIVAEELREYEQARSLYQQALDIYIEFNDRYEQADTYHQLGIVAEELREYEQARSLYQQALDIYIEFNDRYSQANTYGQLGLLAEAQEDYSEAGSQLIKALDIFLVFNDEHSTEITLNSLKRIYQATQDADLLSAVAITIEQPVETIQTLFTTEKEDSTE